MKASPRPGDLISTYERAARVTSPNIHQKLVFGHTVIPNWIGDGGRFWFMSRERSGTRFLVVDPDERTVAPAFDHERVASELSKATGRPVDQKSLPIRRIEFVGDSIMVDAIENRWNLDLGSHKLEPATTEAPWRRDELVSPDGKRAAFVREHNLWIRGADGSGEFQLTSDGREDLAYATAPDALTRAEIGPLGVALPPTATWSPDSSKIFTHQVDQLQVAELVVLEFLANEGRPIPHKWRFPLPGDEQVPTYSLLVIDVNDRTIVRGNHDPFPVAYFLSPIMFGRSWWAADSSKAFVLVFGRGEKSMTLAELDAFTGELRPVITEESDTPVLDAPGRGPSNVQVVGNGAEIIWWSERDGWGHLYLYDGEGNLKNRITSGEWVVRELIHVDDQARSIYFTASGKDGEDPYLRHFYRVDFNGSNLRRLDEEDLDHSVVAGPNGRFFLDTYSTIATRPTTVVRDQAGSVVVEVGRADTTALEEEAWVWPERFRVKAADGVTDIWGTMFRPSNYDPAASYPLIDDVYPGVNVIRAWPSWPDERGRPTFGNAQAIAELGFVVVCIDGRGGPFRSKAFREMSYGNVGDGPWLDDHISAMKQLADKHPCLDLTRVGIYGHSLGGYASARAIMKYPDFFKAAVSSAGAHDARYLWYGIPEFQLGLDLEKYQSQSNLELVGDLQGKLLLIQGGADLSVGFHVMMRFVDALIKANKNFELLVVPDVGHGLLGVHGYVLKRYWDFFVRHLLNEEPPEDFVVPEPRLDFSTSSLP